MAVSLTMLVAAMPSVHNATHKTPSVFILYTGGTIGSKLGPDGVGLAPVNTSEFKAELLALPGFAEDSVTINLSDDYPEFLIDYTVEALTPAIDSSSMTPEQWLVIAERLLPQLMLYDGVVVLHGTDTLAYTSSALAFLLSGSPKPIVVTGSQIPLLYSRNDATLNLMTSIAVGATSHIPGVVVAFDERIISGPRAVKVNADFIDGFDSPNFPQIGYNGISITYEPQYELPMPSPQDSITSLTNTAERKKQLKLLHESFKQLSVVVLTLYPGIESSTVNAMLTGSTPTVKGVCIEAFGSGNAPADPDLTRVLKHAHEAGVVLVDVTQVLTGTVNLDQYAAASGLKDAGAVSGRDMTTEACYAKLVYLAGIGLSQNNIENLFGVDMVGEVTIKTAPAPPSPLVPEVGQDHRNWNASTLASYASPSPPLLPPLSVGMNVLAAAIVGSVVVGFGLHAAYQWLRSRGYLSSTGQAAFVEMG